MKPFDQKAARQVTEHNLVAWSALADALAARPRVGDFNWTMIVRSLIAEIRRLQESKP